MINILTDCVMYNFLIKLRKIRKDFFYNKNFKILYFLFVKNLIYMKDFSFMLEVIK